MKKSFIIVISLILLDQITKYIATLYLDMYESVEIIKGFFSFTLISNTGAAWGLLSGQKYFFYIITVAAVTLIIYMLYKLPAEKKIQKLGLLFFVAGALGNFIDRLFLDGVRDFIDIVIPVINYNFPIFNFADIELVVGVGILIIGMFVEDRK